MEEKMIFCGHCLVGDHLTNSISFGLVLESVWMRELRFVAMINPVFPYVYSLWQTQPRTHVPPWCFLYLTETKSWRCEEERRGEEGREEKVHLKTHAPLGGRMGKKLPHWHT